MTTQYWLMKSEPDEFSLDDLKTVKKEAWSGVRNYQARNFMRDDMKKGDLVLFYHSSTRPPGIVGLAEVSKEAFPDDSAFNKKSQYFDPKSNPKKPRWYMVEIKYLKHFKNIITLDELKKEKALKDMIVTQKGNRLSITPVKKSEYDHILKMAKA